ncbi:methyltransferase domain-containing protein [Uliginosibacterium sp. H1]|uniref:methyltransferase domain-containing protein n=1 Tax=Uliginosibacterium sp. H1 TaxID=3114757 RepID=UPI002E174196|nr:methyltransferase domain-containing protein [Uliginosibacterium sp. H1]
MTEATENRAGFADRSGVMARLAAGQRLALELGCGSRKRHAEAIGVDALDYPGVDLVGDVFSVLAALPAASVSAVHAYHFFEHVADLDRLLAEVARVMTPGAMLDVEVPHFANPYFYSDPTHSRFFGLYTFSYLARSSLFRRGVPQYGREPAFELMDVRLDFDSPFPLRGLVRRAMGKLFNASRWLQEFHEENLCYLLPCYQLRYVLRRL